MCSVTEESWEMDFSDVSTDPEAGVHMTLSIQHVTDVTEIYIVKDQFKKTFQNQISDANMTS